MNFETHSYNSAKEIISNQVIDYTNSILTATDVSKYKYTTRLRAQLLRELGKRGWSNRVRIHASSRITITSQYEDIGLCLQTGNVSRYYADLLKLQTLFSNQVIRSAIFIVPTKREAKMIGSNIVSYERVIEELAVFYKTIQVPLLIFGIERD